MGQMLEALAHRIHRISCAMEAILIRWQARWDRASLDLEGAIPPTAAQALRGMADSHQWVAMVMVEEALRILAVSLRAQPEARAAGCQRAAVEPGAALQKTMAQKRAACSIASISSAFFRAQNTKRAESPG